MKRKCQSNDRPSVLVSVISNRNHAERLRILCFLANVFELFSNGFDQFEMYVANLFHSFVRSFIRCDCEILMITIHWVWSDLTSVGFPSLTSSVNQLTASSTIVGSRKLAEFIGLEIKVRIIRRRHTLAGNHFGNASLLKSSSV